MMFALKVTRDGHHIRDARLAMGGMAATPKRAALTEAALRGLNLADEALFQSAISMLTKDYQPISDMRASSAYRLETAQALLHKALIELSGHTDTRVMGQREVAA